MEGQHIWVQILVLTINNSEILVLTFHLKNESKSTNFIGVYVSNNVHKVLNQLAGLGFSNNIFENTLLLKLV